MQSQDLRPRISCECSRRGRRSRNKSRAMRPFELKAITSPSPSLFIDLRASRCFVHFQSILALCLDPSSVKCSSGYTLNFPLPTLAPFITRSVSSDSAGRVTLFCPLSVSIDLELHFISPLLGPVTLENFARFPLLTPLLTRDAAYERAGPDFSYRRCQTSVPVGLRNMC